MNRTSFGNEIDRAFEQIYMTYWLKNKAAEDHEIIKDLENARKELTAAIEELKAQYEEASEQIPRLNVKAAEISNQIGHLQGKLQNLETELKEQAVEELSWPAGCKGGRCNQRFFRGDVP
ncbi:hypothetical protein [Candidatus Entotheonella palauensis]|uniref:Uncharacterized protein n=1 Tax=Candidatus Entotheonella gemina TaxID=1429439 RepID=W4LLS2_9BACT|nr:hypothetical protein [Candidatus Entotheonella palauensis]ETW98276.1 MAG: hypothetical protein ETSY2_43045 [Candidatus Entotheonella gemina]